jgi:hypothetical protein
MMNPQDYAETIIAIRTTSLPTISGSAPSEIGQSGVFALIFIGGKDYIEVPVDPVTGRYTWTATTPMPDGDYSLSIITRDPAGNIGTPTLRTLRIDTTPPEAPELLNLYDDFGQKHGSFDAGQTTDDKRPKLTGIAQQGTTVYLRDESGNTIGSAVADKKTGKWVMEPSEDLKDGVNNLTLVAEEKIGAEIRTGTPSEPFAIVIGPDGGILPPDTITITQAIDDQGSATGVLSNGALTDDTTPTLSGRVSAGSTVIVSYRLVGSTSWASATATVDGQDWSWTPGNALNTGRYEFYAANGTNSSAPFILDIASAADIISRTRIDSVEDNVGTAVGWLTSGAITDDATPTFRGTAEANSKVVIRYTRADIAATVVVDADSAGQWNWTPGADLSFGVWSFEVQPQGHTAWSEAFTLDIIDPSTGGFPPVIDYVQDNVGSDTGKRYSGATTDDQTPELHGRAEANSDVKLRFKLAGGSWTELTVVADTAGNWHWTPPTLQYGNWTFEVQKAGQGGWSSFDLKLASDTGYSGMIDFETGSTPTPNMTPWGTWYKRDYAYDDMTFSTYKLGTSLDLVSAESFGEPSFGQTSLLFKTQEYLELTPRQDANFATSLTDFSIVIYNPNTHAINFRFSLTVRKQDGSIEERGYVNPKTIPGINNVTLESLGEQNDTSLLLEGESIVKLQMYNHYVPSEGAIGNKPIYIDNINWTTKGSGDKTALFAAEDDSIHHLDGIDALAEKPVLGSEDKTNILQLTGKDQLLDLTTLGSKIESVEIFDITGSGDNTLKIDISALLEHGEKDLFIEDGKTQLMVKGNEGDVVQLKDILPEGSDISEWQHQDGTVTVAGVEYQVYSHNDAELLVQQGVKTELI